MQGLYTIQNIVLSCDVAIRPMKGILILLLLIVTAALPVIIVFFWFRAAKSTVTLPWFLTSLTAGIVSLLFAVLFQNFFPLPGTIGLWSVFFGVFIRIALVEETSRLVSLIPLLSVSKLRRNLDERFCASLGLVSGLGFAMMESAFYGLSDINIILFRAITAAPLHGACSIRVGAAFFIAGKHPLRALFLFVSAVLIHGAYNLMIINPILPSILAVPIAFAAFFASVHFIQSTKEDDENSFISKSPLS